MSFRLFLSILRARFGIVLITLLVSVGVAGALTYYAPRKYTGETFLLLSYKDENPVDSTLIPGQLSSSYLATQLDIIRSRRVALKVVAALHLDEAQGWKGAYKQYLQDATPEQRKLAPGIEDWIAGQMITNLTVTPQPNSSHVVSLQYVSSGAAESARIANAYAQAFLATTLELTVEPARRNAAWFDEQVKVLRKRLEAAQARVTELQVQKGIVALDEKLSAETLRLDDISKKLIEAQVATADARSRGYGENHPEMVRAMQSERALTIAMDQQRRNILALKGQRDELNARQSEMESEQQNYTATLQNYYKASFASQFVQTNISILSPAVAPTDPSSPDILLNMVGATVLGLILGLVAALGAEMINPRVQVRKEAA